MATWDNGGTTSTTSDITYTVCLADLTFPKPAKKAEPAPSTPMAWLDARVDEVTARGRSLLAA